MKTPIINMKTPIIDEKNMVNMKFDDHKYVLRFHKSR